MRHSISTPHDQYPQLMSIDSHYPSPSHTPAFQIPHFKHKSPSVNSNITGTRIRHEPIPATRPSDFHSSHRRTDMEHSQRRHDIAPSPRRSEINSTSTRRIESPGAMPFKRFTEKHANPMPLTTKDRSNSECSSTSSSKADISSSNSPKSTDLLSELKMRQSRRGQSMNGSNESLPSRPAVSIPAKPKILKSNLNSHNSSNSGTHSTNVNRSSSSEDFSFKAVLNRAKIHEAESIKKLKPTPPPKPKFNLT